MIDEEQVKNIVRKALDEEHLTGFIKIFEKEHNIFRGSHDKIGLPETLVIPQKIVTQIVEKFETQLTKGSIPFIDEHSHFTENKDEFFYDEEKKILCLGLNSPETDMVGGFCMKEGTPPTQNIIDTIQVYALDTPTERLTDGGLEVWAGAGDLTHWTEFDAGGLSEVAREETEKHSGSFSCRLYTGAQGDYAGFYQDFTLTPSESCKVSTWYLRTAHEASTLRLYVTTPGYDIYLKPDGTWTIDETIIYLTTTEVWKLLELNFTSHPDYSDYRIRFYKAQGAGGGTSSFYVDDVSVAEIGNIIPYFRTSTGIVIGLDQDLRKSASVIYAGLTLTGLDGVLKAVDGVVTEAADHIDLANITSDQHHPQLHASEHHVGGGDLVNHDNLTGFVAAEHLSLPNTIDNVLSNHTKAVHDVLGLDHGSLSGKGDDDHTIYILADGTRAFTGVVLGITPTLAAHLATKGYVDTQEGGVNEFIELTDTPGSYTGQAGKFVKVNATPDALIFAAIAWTDVSKTGSNLTDLVTRQHAGLTNITSDQHHPQSHSLASHSSKAHSELTGIGINDHHAQAHSLASHSSKAHSELTGVTSDLHHAKLHAASHANGQGDELSHDALKDFVGAKHLSLPNTIAQVLSDHTLAVHNALDITELGTVSSGIWQGTAIANAYIAGINQNLLTTSNVTFINISGNRFIQVASGIPSSNLGAPTVTEMALFDPQFENKTEFYDISNLKFYIYDAGWDEYTDPTDANKRKFLGGDASSGIFIPNLAEKFRIEITNSGPYVFLNALYMYWSSNSHNTTVHIWKRKYSTQVWSQVTSSATTVSAWPGHMYLPFSTIPFHPTSDTHYDAIRIEFTPNWSGDPVYGDRDISLYRLQLWGGYPAGKRRLYSIDEYKKATFPGDLAVPKLIIGSYYLNSLIANNKVPDSDKLDGEHGSYYSPTTHDHVKADITDTPWAWTDVSKTGSNLTDLATRQHAGLTNITSDQHHPQAHSLASHSSKAHNELSDAPADAHHPQLHAASHASGQADVLNHDNLAGFVGAEHLSLPNSMANVINSGHTKAVHDGLGLDHGSLSGKGDNDHTQYILHSLADAANDFLVASGANTFIRKTLAQTGAILEGDMQHDNLQGFVGAEHLSLPNTIANVLSNHTKAVHDSLLITILGSGALAKDHGAAATDMLVNVCYGTGAPPTANLTTIGTIFIRYTA